MNTTLIHIIHAHRKVLEMNFSGFLLQDKLFGLLYDVVTGDKFEIAILTVIMCNMVMMTIQHYGQSTEITGVLHILSESKLRQSFI